MLSLENASVSIAGSPILRGVSLRIEAGRTTVLLGRNGAGKTTTLRTIMGLLPLDKRAAGAGRARTSRRARSTTARRSASAMHRRTGG